MKESIAEGQVLGHRVLQRSAPSGKQLVIPPEGGLRQLLMDNVHSPNHFGVKHTLALLQSHVFWPCMGNDVAAFVRGCEFC